MPRRLLTALLAVSLLFPVVAVPTFAVAGDCWDGSTTNQHYVVQKLSKNAQLPTDPIQNRTFDAVVGEITLRDLDNCNAAAVGPRGTYVLPANVETTAGNIYQMGYQEDYVRGNRFIYADRDASVLYWNGNIQPIYGHRYRFRINLNGTYASFTLTDLTTGVSEAKAGATEAVGSALYAWWGAERQDTESNIGNQHNASDYDMTQMGYSLSGVSGFIYRSGLNINSASSTPGGDEDFYKAPGLQSCHERHVETTTYTNDTVNFDTTSIC